MKITMSYIAPKIDFMPNGPDSVIIAYQCNNESQLRPERFMIYYGLFRANDKNPTPELVAQWRIKQRKLIVEG